MDDRSHLLIGQVERKSSRTKSDVRTYSNKNIKTIMRIAVEPRVM